MPLFKSAISWQLAISRQFWRDVFHILNPTESWAASQLWKPGVWSTARTSGRNLLRPALSCGQSSTDAALRRTVHRAAPTPTTPDSYELHGCLAVRRSDLEWCPLHNWAALYTRSISGRRQWSGYAPRLEPVWRANTCKNRRVGFRPGLDSAAACDAACTYQVRGCHSRPGLRSRPNFSDSDSDSDSGLEKSTPTPTPTPAPTPTHISLFFHMSKNNFFKTVVSSLQCLWCKILLAN